MGRGTAPRPLHSAKCIRSSSGVHEKGALETAQPSASPTAMLGHTHTCQLAPSFFPLRFAHFGFSMYLVRA